MPGNTHQPENQREDQNRYRELFNALDVAFCIIEVLFDDQGHPVDYRFLEVNPVFELHTGLSDVQGKRIRELNPRIEEHWFQVYGQVVTDGVPARFQSRSASLQRWFDVFAFRFGPAENHQVAIHFNDITERIQADQKLRESEAKFSKAFHAAPVLISISTIAEGRYLDVNEEFVRVLGFSRSEVVGRTSTELDIWHSADRNQLLETIGKMQRVRDFETQLRSKNGALIVGLISIEVIEIEGRSCLLTITKDITELRRLEDERSRLALIVESSEDAIIGKTLEGVITSWNRGAEKIYGYRAEEVKGRHISLLNLGRDPAEIDLILEQIKRGEEIVRHETLRVRKDGTQIPVALTISPIRDDRGDIVGASTIARDISERRRAEQEIERLNADLAQRADQLESANTDLEAFNYSVAHDLRQPLSVIYSYCQAIQALCEEQLDEECRAFVQGVFDGAQRMNRLIEALLNFSRLARAELHLVPVDLAFLAREVVSELALAEPERQVEVHIEDGLTAYGDPGLLLQVLQNLLGNAWKYTARQPAAVIEFSRQAEDCTFCIRDNGEGFGQNDAERLFVPFQRLPGAEQFRGLGIGLASVARIVVRHGGRIWAEGEPGKGAAFYFTLPPEPEGCPDDAEEAS